MSVTSIHHADFNARLLAGWVVFCVSLAALVVVLNINAPLFVALNATSARYLPDAVPTVVTMFGTAPWAYALLSPCLLLSPRVNIAGLYATPVALALTHVPKTLFTIPRPGAVMHDTVHLLNGPIGWGSFPSGHSITGLTAATVLLLGCRQLQRHHGLTVAILMLVMLVPLSRIAVGAHWPVDVLIGAALGIVSGWVGVRLLQHWSPSDSPRGVRVVALVHLLVAVVLLYSHSDSDAEQLVRIALAIMSGGIALVVLFKPREAGIQVSADQHSAV